MVFPVTTSDSPLEFDTLPALKCRYWQSGSRRVYTLARLYSLYGGLQLSLCAFERVPATDSSIGLALTGNSGQMLWVFLTPKKAGMLLLPTAPATLPGTSALDNSVPLAADHFSGNDEQGWYWGGRLSLSQQVLAKAGCPLRPKGTFRAGLLKYGTGPLGASYPPGDAKKPLDATFFNEFLILDY